MRYDEPRGDWVSLPKPWLELRQGMRNAVLNASEIHTYDGGRLIRIDGVWEVLKSGDHNDADVIRNVLRKAS
ncbi:hypothetical protein LB517_10825 [Mesorhizobium sp. BR1-1-12]|uniref:hypothetical protein n=1 Tax=unclassified Mesorhizobium TaxID=325217 RepID=UPI001CCC23FC|nr:MULTISPECIES: hypothetical protein [unclassified Mesorhizobium]MBZ9919094.1 hypothetical protein [Mesorhizobium sp. BR1-1-7]MBZ9970127.1 hypothetical protein [Mesorhizobium sp. BR1-1-12]